MTGSKTAGTNPRALGTNPRARGTNPRAVDVLATADLTPEELKALAEDSYRQYRRTKHWLSTRREAKKRANNCCENCGATRLLDVHHRSYERLGEELETDLEVLCRTCHEATHKLLTTGGNTWLRDSEGRILGQVIEVVVELAPGILAGEPLRRGVDLPLTTEEQNNNGDGGLEEEPVAAELLQQLPKLRFDELKANHLIGRAIDLVWDHYVTVMEPRSPKHGLEEERLIRDILKVATAEECLRAIDGCKASPWHMGENPRGKKYNRLSQILKGKRGGKTAREQIDMFLDYADTAAAPAIGISPGRVKHLKDAIATYVQTGAERERAERARTTLVEAGVYNSIEFIPAEQRANYVR